jgi:crotonobetainyl-CoA:carnitine CoA-transferase CaiB-like acyl-CoA transferase
VHAPAPAFGEHTREVLADAGLTPEEIDSLFESGAAAGSPEEAGDRSFMG